MTRTDKEVYSQEAFYYYNDGIEALNKGDIQEAEHCFKMVEEYLQDAKIPYEGKGKDLKWSR